MLEDEEGVAKLSQRGQLLAVAMVQEGFASGRQVATTQRVEQRPQVPAGKRNSGMKFGQFRDRAAQPQT